MSEKTRAYENIANARWLIYVNSQSEGDTEENEKKLIDAVMDWAKAARAEKIEERNNA